WKPSPGVVEPALSARCASRRRTSAPPCSFPRATRPQQTRSLPNTCAIHVRPRLPPVTEGGFYVLLHHTVGENDADPCRSAARPVDLDPAGDVHRSWCLGGPRAGPRAAARARLDGARADLVPRLLPPVVLPAPALGRSACAAAVVRSVGLADLGGG